MRFLLDESADFPLAAFLQQLGHDVTAVAHGYPHALKDREVLNIAMNERRVLITNDRDFGELVVRHGLAHAGMILLRLGREDLMTKQWWLRYVLERHSDDLTGVVVVTDHGVRVRPPYLDPGKGSVD